MKVFRRGPDLLVAKMYADPNLKDFERRVSRVQKARAKGYGFEAPGTLGRSASMRHKQRSSSFVKPFLVLVLMSVGLKAGIHYKIGGDVYQARVNSLAQGEGFDRLGGWLMQADPATLAVSAFLTQQFPRQL